MIKITSRLPASRASDGAGVKILRIAPSDYSMLDPFLMLDELKGETPSDVENGFPPHPHRGFETITLVKTGAIDHTDSMGNSGRVDAGGAQWMTAGSGVIHSEMPKPDASGHFHGFQLWLNLPSHQKMRAPEYRDLQCEDTGFYNEDGSCLRVFGGSFGVNDHLIEGPIGDRLSRPHLADLCLNPDVPLTVSMPSDLSCFLYVYRGEIRLGGQLLEAGNLYRVSHEGVMELSCDTEVSLLLLGGAPLHETVVQYGPFVMNSAEQIEAALSDYRAGTLVQTT